MKKRTWIPKIGEKVFISIWEKDGEYLKADVLIGLWSERESLKKALEKGRVFKTAKQALTQAQEVVSVLNSMKEPRQLPAGYSKPIPCTSSEMLKLIQNFYEKI